MKKVVITLASTPERLEKFKENFPFSITTYFGAEGKKIDRKSLKTLNIDVYPAWRGPYNNRRLTKGEVGCFISHYLLWQTISIQDDPWFVFEDDANLAVWSESKLDALGQQLQQSNVDFLLLGYNENFSSSQHPPIGDFSVVQLTKPYNSHGYYITPATAKLFLDSFEGIIPVDDYFGFVQTKTNLKILGLATNKVPQQPRTIFPSSIEPTGEDDYFVSFDTHVLTYATDSSKTNILYDSAASHGVYPLNLGLNHEWNGGSMVSTGGMQKLHGLYQYVKSLPDNDVVLFTDGYDVFYTNTLETIVKRFLGFNVSVLFAAEKTCWPDKEKAARYPQSQYESKYLNSGCFIGDVATIKAILEGVDAYQPDDDDQRYLTEKFLSGQYKSLALDYEGYIFQTGYDSEKLRGHLYNRAAHCMGCIYHGAGPQAAKDYFNDLAQQFAPPTHFNYIPGLNKIDIISPDMLVVDFLTKSQCDQIIERAEAHGNWASLAYDKFPAQEIRLKKLDLWNTFVERWQSQIVPIVEKYFFPLKMYGVRDMFVMKYTLDTQKSLALHHDASLLTGSIKLNENYTGANLVFPRQQVSNASVPVGKIILFPGQVTHPHQCEDLTRGTKYSMTIWTKRNANDSDV